MIRIADGFLVERPLEQVFELFDRVDAIAQCMPTLKRWEVGEGGRILGTVGVTLGAIPVESRVLIEIARREPARCLVARGISYLGETVAAKRGAANPLDGIDGSSSGRFTIHFDFRPHEGGRTLVAYEAEVEAEGRLRRIYQAIVQSKVPAFQREFKERLGRALGGADLLPIPEGSAIERCRGAEGLVRAGAAEAAEPDAAGPPLAAGGAMIAASRPGLIRRIVAALARIVRRILRKA